MSNADEVMTKSRRPQLARTHTHTHTHTFIHANTHTHKPSREIMQFLALGLSLYAENAIHQTSSVVQGDHSTHSEGSSQLAKQKESKELAGSQSANTNDKCCRRLKWS